MSRYFSFLLVALLALSLVACGDDDEDDTTSGTNASDKAEQITVVATTSQIGALVQAVAGDQVELHTLMGPGVNAHDYEVTPDDIRVMSDANLILRNGIGLDDFLDDSIEAAGGSANVITVTDGINLIEGDEGEYDPHVWHDPGNAKMMVDNIAAALSTVDDARAETYQENADAYNTVLDETDAEIQAMIDEIPQENRKLVTNHDAFGYFIQAYDLEFVGAVIPSTSTGAEPSAQEIAELSELIERDDLQAIFAESSVDPRIAEQLASDTGVEIVYGLYSDSLGEPGSDAETVHGMLLANATKISEALK